ncbi:MAG: hypothetical protein IJ223_05930 [Clostridia bacterium]|nr:hypothetical protein [Clostridia bacterium]
MKSSEKRYLVRGWSGFFTPFTATELYERVIKDCQTKFNWFTSAEELVRVCETTGFPIEYATEIKAAILNCFANGQFQKENWGFACIYSGKDLKALYHCYNSLPVTDKPLFDIKKKYLFALIKDVSDTHYPIPIHPNSHVYTEVCENWINRQFERNIFRDDINFPNFITYLHENFETEIEIAEKKGLFQKDDEEMKKRFSKYDEIF